MSLQGGNTSEEGSMAGGAAGAPRSIVGRASCSRNNQRIQDWVWCQERFSAELSLKHDFSSRATRSSLTLPGGGTESRPNH